MKILVTGGLGVVGAHLVRELRGRGNEVWMCDLHHDHDPQYVRCDVSAYCQLERLIAARGFESSTTWPRNSGAGTGRTTTRRCGGRT